MKNDFELQLPDLVYFVKASCHEGLHDVLNDVRDLSSGMERSELVTFVKKFMSFIQRHLLQEEHHLYPFLDATSNESFAMFVTSLMSEHEEFKECILKLKRLTHNYQPPIEADANGVNFYAKLKEMERILLNHIQIEDNILFPMIYDRH